MSGFQSISLSAAQAYATVAPQQQQSLHPFSNLDLTAAQRTDLRSIFSNARKNGTSPSEVAQQINGILTPAQQQTLASDLKARGGTPPGAPASTSSTTAPATTTDAQATTSEATQSQSEAVISAQNQAVAAQSTLVENLRTTVLNNGSTSS